MRASGNELCMPEFPWVKIEVAQHNMPCLQECILQNLEVKKQQTTWPQKRIKKSASARPLEGPFSAAEAKQVRHG